MIENNREYQIHKLLNSELVYTNCVYETLNMFFKNVNLVINIESSDIKELFRRVFTSRLILDKLLKNLSINHIIGLMLYSPTGCGKCLGLDTPVMMYDGSIKMVQNIQIGEQLMGDNSEPRNVISLARGQEQMYKIVQDYGNSYIVNSSHILSLYNPKTNNIVDISVKDYLELKEIYVGPIIFEGQIQIQKKNILMKKHHMVKGGLYGFKVKTNFKAKPIPFDSYLFGKFIVNYKYNNNEINTNDNLIIINDYFNQNDLEKNPKIPLEYKANESNIQLNVLAGIIDSIGIIKDNSYLINLSNIAKNTKLLEDICFILMSLNYKYKIENSAGVYKLILDTNTNIIIPTIINKISKDFETKINLNINWYQIQLIPLGIDDYYGFGIDSNRRFLLGDFTVTHNTFSFFAI